jgi:hypothetical protein
MFEIKNDLSPCEIHTFVEDLSHYELFNDADIPNAF